MAWTTTDGLGACRTAAGGFLRARPAQHTTLLTVASSPAAMGADRYGERPPVYGWWCRDGGTGATEAVDGRVSVHPALPPAADGHAR